MVNFATCIPSSEQQIGALLIDLGSITRKRAGAPVQDAQQGKYERVGAYVRNTCALCKECLCVICIGFGVLSKPLAYVLANLLLTEPAQTIAGEPTFIQPCLVITDQPRCDEYRGERILTAEPLYPCSYILTAGSVKQLIEAVENHYGTAGQKQQVYKSRRRWALVKSFQLMLDMHCD